MQKNDFGKRAGRKRPHPQSLRGFRAAMTQKPLEEDSRAARAHEAQPKTLLGLSDQETSAQSKQVTAPVTGSEPLLRPQPENYQRKKGSSLEALERVAGDSRPCASRLGSPHSRSPPRAPGPLDSPFKRPPALLGPFNTGIQSPEVFVCHLNSLITSCYCPMLLCWLHLCCSRTLLFLPTSTIPVASRP